MTSDPKATEPLTVSGLIPVLVHRLMTMLRRLALGIVAATDGLETDNPAIQRPAPLDHASAVGRWWAEVERGAPGFALALREQAGGSPPTNLRRPRLGFDPVRMAGRRRRVFDRLIRIGGGDRPFGGTGQGPRVADTDQGPRVAGTDQDRSVVGPGGWRQGRGSTDSTEPGSGSVGDLTGVGRVGFGLDGDDPRSASDPTPPTTPEFSDDRSTIGHPRSVDDPNGRSWWNSPHPDPNRGAGSSATPPDPNPQVRSSGTYLGTEQVSISFSRPPSVHRQPPNPGDEPVRTAPFTEPPDRLRQPDDPGRVPLDPEPGVRWPTGNSHDRPVPRAPHQEMSRPVDHSGIQGPTVTPQPVQWPSLPSPTAPLPLVASQFETKHREEQMGVAPC